MFEDIFENRLFCREIYKKVFPLRRGLSGFEFTNRVLGGGVTEVWAGDFEVRTGSLGICTSIRQMLAVTRWSLPWNRYVIVQQPLIAVGWFFAL